MPSGLRVRVPSSAYIRSLINVRLLIFENRYCNQLNHVKQRGGHVKNSMCLYEISKAPYLAVSNVYHSSSCGCLIEDCNGRLRRVKPIYECPFDHVKLKEFGELLVSYFQKDSTLKISDVHDRAKKIFQR